MYVSMYVCMYVCMYACKYVFKYVCMPACMYTYMVHGHLSQNGIIMIGIVFLIDYHSSPKWEKKPFDMANMAKASVKKKGSKVLNREVE